MSTYYVQTACSLSHLYSDMRFAPWTDSVAVAASEGDIPAAKLAAVVETENKFRTDTEKPRNISKYASRASAKLLGMDPDPKTGGTDGPVTYIVFAGATGRIPDPKDMRITPPARTFVLNRSLSLTPWLQPGE